MLHVPQQQSRQAIRPAGEAVMQMSGNIRTDLSRGREERSATSAISTGSDRPPDVYKYGGFDNCRQQNLALSIRSAVKCIHGSRLHWRGVAGV